MNDFNMSVTSTTTKEYTPSYYEQNSDLAAFDNGAGGHQVIRALFTEKNKSVSLDELAYYGEQKLNNENAQTTYTREECLARAAADLAQVLQSKPTEVAQDYVTSVLRSSAADYFKENGGASYYPDQKTASNEGVFSSAVAYALTPVPYDVFLGKMQ
ncbi:MAG: hypothetical protein ABII18_12520 [bacterium]|nr:hypothetical protein [bacterium]MBU1916639.1 hypothetical protein [bacterium]